MGCLTSIVVAATAIPVLDDYKPDTSTFPEIKDDTQTYDYQFPELLEASGSKADASKPVATATEAIAITELKNQLDDENQFSGYMLQAGSFEQKDRADVFRAALMLRGYQAKTSEIEIINVGTRFRVVIGPYPTEQAAKSAITQLRGEQVESMLLGSNGT